MGADAPPLIGPAGHVSPVGEKHRVGLASPKSPPIFPGRRPGTHGASLQALSLPSDPDRADARPGKMEWCVRKGRASWRALHPQSLAESAPYPVFQVKGAKGAAPRFHP